MRRILLSASLILLVALYPEITMAGGWDGAVVGPRGGTMGTAFAGLADDPSAIFYNPAGIALLDREQGLAVSVRYNASTLKYQFPEGRRSPSGKDSGESDLMGVLPDIFYYHKLGNFSAGIGIYIPYGGLAGTWDPDVFGVDMNQFMAVASITPSFSWAITPKLAVGAGLNVYYGFMKSKVNMNQIPTAMFGSLLPDQLNELFHLTHLVYLPIRLKQEFYASGPALGYNVGILYKPLKQLGFGVCLRSGADVTLTGPATITLPVVDPLAITIDSDLEIKYKLPYILIAGLSFRPISCLVLVADLYYGGWGRLSDIQLTFKKLNFTQVNPTGYGDIVTFMLGMEYTFLEHYSARIGYKRFPNTIKHEEDLSYQSWDTTMNTFSFGLGYSWTNFSIHAIGMVSVGDWNEKHFDDPNDPIGKPKGKYTTFFQTYGLGILWYF